MPSTVLVGAQWGDEGKGKITDLIASDYDYVVRFQGGNNAGHTVIHGDIPYLMFWEKYLDISTALQIVPA